MGNVVGQVYPTSPVLNITLVNQIPDPARTGESVELSFMVENIGGVEVNDIEIELLAKYPFISIYGEDYTREITQILPYQTGTDAYIIKYEIMVDKDAVKGINDINLRIRYGDSGATVVKKFDVQVVGTEFAQIIYIDKAKIDPGKETELEFTITNVGNSPLQNLLFSWNEEGGVLLPVYADNTKYIQYLDTGESIDLVYNVIADVNTDPGLYQLDLMLRYETGDGTAEEVNTIAGVFIGGGTDFDVTFSESSEGETSLSIANIGNNPALSVTVRIPEQDNYRVSGSSSSIIGNLDKGDYTIVSFQISASPAGFQGRPFQGNQSFREAMPEGDLRVSIEYTDTTGERHIIEKMVPISFREISSDATTTAFYVRQRSNPLSTIGFYGGIIVIIIIGFALFKKRESIRKKIKKEPKHE